MQKCYNVLITGDVQDVGFRILIERIAVFLELKGYVFNDTDGSVKMVCCGENGIISSFLKEIRARGEEKGARIEKIEKEELPFNIPLPEKFIRLYTDELEAVSRKLDVGIEVLKEIKSDTSAIRKDTSALPEIKTILESFVLEQREHNKRMDEHNKSLDEHNKRLEKILEKLAQR